MTIELICCHEPDLPGNLFDRKMRFCQQAYGLADSNLIAMCHHRPARMLLEEMTEVPCRKIHDSSHRDEARCRTRSSAG